MAKKNISALIEQSRREMDGGAYSKAYKILAPLVDRKIPEALFLYSTFSISDIETDDEFERRSFRLLTESADLGYAPAIYALGVCYDAGDLIEKNPLIAAKLFKKAAELGHCEAKLNYGLDLFYGSNGIPRDKEMGIEFVRQAVDGNVDGAREMLDKLMAMQKK